MAESYTYMFNFENIISPGNEPDMSKPYKPKIPYQFEKYLSPEELKSYVLHSPNMAATIQRHACETKQSEKDVKKQVHKIIDEIGIERNLPIIRWCGMAITAIGKRICDGIYVNASSIANVKEHLGAAPVLYLPSHRSYMDFILMSYICFHYGIEIPAIAAGMDFHSMFGMGTMLRKTGAFFMRRSFSNDELYWNVFREYVYALTARYHIGIEFFIEGTRSRNFKALVPKIGLLSMALMPFFTGDVPDVIIVPVSISYDRLLEEQLYVYELLGVPKPKESTRGFLKALKIIEERFGKMYLDFGEPISVRDYLGVNSLQRMQRASIGPHLQTLNTTEVEQIKRLADEIIYQQQRRIVINTFNLISLYYSSQIYGGVALHIDNLLNSVSHLKGIFEKLGAHVSTNESDLRADILHVLKIHSNIVYLRNNHLEFSQIVADKVVEYVDPKKLKAHSLSTETMSIALPMLALQLYVNPCLFWLARPAYLILSALCLQKTSTNKEPLSNSDDTVKHMIRLANELDEIFQHEFIMDAERKNEEFKEHIKLLQEENVLNISALTGRIEVHDNEWSRVILSALVPFLCLYYQLVITLREFPDDMEFTNKDLLVRMQQRIENMLKEPKERNVHPYCLALDNLNIAIYSFIQCGYLQKNRDSGKLRHIPNSLLYKLKDKLEHYCQLMPFEQYHMYIIQAVLWTQSKL